MTTTIVYGLTTTFFAVTMVSGIAIAFVRQRRHPAVSSCIALGLGIMLLTSVATFVATIILSRGMPMQDFNTVYSAINLLASALRTAAWVLILMAVFGWRTSEESGHGDKAAEDNQAPRPGDERNPYQPPA